MVLHFAMPAFSLFTKGISRVGVVKLFLSSPLTYKIKRGARYLTEENLNVIWAECSL
jgi:hypothetical protein